MKMCIHINDFHPIIRIPLSVCH